LLAAKKWISLSSEDKSPRIFSIRLDESVEDVDDLKNAIEKTAQISEPADQLQLEYPLGTILPPSALLTAIEGGNAASDLIHASLPKEAAFILSYCDLLCLMSLLSNSTADTAILEESDFEGQRCFRYGGVGPSATFACQVYQHRMMSRHTTFESNHES
jgi:hypothetical protein